MEFHAERPRRPRAATEDPEEAEEEDSDEARNGFSLEEVLRLGGTKVTAAGSGQGTAARPPAPGAALGRETETRMASVLPGPRPLRM